MDLENLNILALENQRDWRAFTEIKINNIINRVRNPEWDKLLSFFQKDKIWDFSHIQAPSYALEYSNNDTHLNTKLYLYLHINLPIFTCFFMSSTFDAGIEGSKIIISTTTKDTNMNLSLDQLIKNVSKVFPGHQFVSHNILFQKRVKWGIPLGGFEKELGSFPFEYLFHDFTIISDQITIQE